MTIRAISIPAKDRLSRCVYGIVDRGSRLRRRARTSSQSC